MGVRQAMVTHGALVLVLRHLLTGRTTFRCATSGLRGAVVVMLTTVTSQYAPARCSNDRCKYLHRATLGGCSQRCGRPTIKPRASDRLGVRQSHRFRVSEIDLRQRDKFCGSKDCIWRIHTMIQQFSGAPALHLIELQKRVHV